MEESAEVHLDIMEDESQRSSVDMDPMELAAIVALTDIGSYMMKKTGKAGQSPAQDYLPYFASMRRRWYFIVWEGDPSEWRIVSARDKIEDPYSSRFVSEETPIYLKDISEIYLEPPPNQGIRLYRNDEVIQLSPLSYSMSESTAWADAFRAAFTLQDMPTELVLHVRQAYYDMLATQTAPAPSTVRTGGELEVINENEMVLGGDGGKGNTLSKSESQNPLNSDDRVPETGFSGCIHRWFGKKPS